MSKYGSMLRHLTTYSIGIVAGKLASVLLLPIYTHYLAPADYGVLELLEISSSVIATLVALRLSDAFFYFDSQSGENRRRTVLMTAYLGGGLAGIAVGLGGWFCSAFLSRLVFGTEEYTPGFQLVSLGTALAFVQEIGFAHLRVLNKSQAFLAIQVGRLAVQAGTSVLFLAHGDGYLGVQKGAVIASLSACLVFVPYALVSHRAAVDLALLRSLFRYAAPLGVSGVAMLFVHFGDRWFLQRSASLSALGLYSLAYKGAMVVGYAQLAFDTYWNAQMFAILKEGKGSSMYVRLCTYYALALMTAAVVLTALARPGVLLLTPPAFHPAIVYIPLLAGAYVVRGLADYVRSPLLVENRPGLTARVILWTAGICLVLYATLIPPFKAWGAVAATGLSFVAMAILSFVQAQRVRSFSFETGRLVRIGIAGAASLATMMFGSGDVFSQTLISLAGLAVYGTALILSGFFQSEERDFASKALHAARAIFR
jgi:O-antigen/teichoic acid export membrane protein